MPLRRKILLYSSALILTLSAAMLIYVNYQAERFVNERIGADLEQGRQRIKIIENERRTGLRLTAQLVASFPDLKALLGTDTATIRDFLDSYQKQNRRSELLIALEPTGRVVARTDLPTPLPIPDAGERWVQPALAEQSASGVLTTQQAVYYAEAVPSTAGGIVFGFVIAGARIDNAFAQTLRGLSEDEVVIVGDHVLGTTLPGDKLPWRTRAEWESTAGGGRQKTLDIRGESYAALRVALGPGDAAGLFAVILRSRDLALEPYRRIQFGLVVLGLLAAVAGISASAVLAGTVTSPIGKLVEGTKQVAAGNFDSLLDIRSGDEIGDLAQSFNSMMRGLRERADMQKFVSQSTMEMIQANSPRKTSAGERKLLTMFFSDIRGFTLMSERRPPEEAVKILNSCLSLQANKVKQFRGDIDKYVGDCVVALFSGEESALSAIRCAIEIQKALDGHNAANAVEQPVRVGIGIVTGEVILGSIGSEDRRDFTAVGSNVNLCARLCSMAGPGEILLAESSYLPVQDLVAAERLEPLNLKGFTKPIPVYRVAVR